MTSFACGEASSDEVEKLPKQPFDVCQVESTRAESDAQNCLAQKFAKKYLETPFTPMQIGG